MTFEQELIDIIPDLRLYARSRTNNQDDADDLVQKTLIRALEKQAFFKGGKLIAWAITMMKNIRIDDVRKTRGVTISDIEIDETISSGPTDTSQDLNDVNDALLKLDEKCREILVLIGGGYSYKEISSTLLMNMGTLMGRLHRCREKLLKNLQ
jgi:RNA polymerase sigma-70 factor (ECF subfamily)